MPDDQGLRERKKRATRDALRLAALRLATTREWADVRVEDIAAEAGVSTRTFNNYFASKEDVFLANAYERAARARAALAARPAGEPLWTALTAAIIDSFATEEADLSRAGEMAPPRALFGEQLKAFAVIERTLAGAIAERIGADHDLYSRLVAAAVMGTTRVALTYWLRKGAHQPFPEVLRDALGQVAAGLPQPSGRSSQ